MGFLLSKVPYLRLIAKRELDIMDIQKENPDLSLTSKLETRQEREAITYIYMHNLIGEPGLEVIPPRPKVKEDFFTAGPITPPSNETACTTYNSTRGRKHKEEDH